MRIALVAAYLLVLQSVIGAVAFAEGPGQIDAFGNPLCASSTGHSDAGSHHSGHLKLPDCCTPGCSMFSVAVSPPSQQGIAHLRLVLVLNLPPTRDGTVPFARGYNPGNPRAPPPTA